VTCIAAFPTSFKRACCGGEVQVNLSFGSETGRTRSGAKGFSSKEKKQKKKKQDFHTHRRAHFRESERPDPEEVRARTIIALGKLGHQVLSTEPGAYDLRAWLKSLNSLLDDFQEKIGADKMDDELRIRREEVALSLVPSSSTSDFDKEIEKLNHEAATIKAELQESERRATSRRASLRDERDVCSKELKVEREKLAELQEARQSRALFSRLLKSGPSTDEAEARVAQLEAKLKGLEDEIDRSLKTKQAPSGGALEDSGASDVEAVKRLEAIQERLTELDSAKQARLQLAQEREMAAKTISDVISSMRLGAVQSGASGAQAQ